MGGGGEGPGFIRVFQGEPKGIPPNLFASAFRRISFQCALVLKGIDVHDWKYVFVCLFQGTQANGVLAGPLQKRKTGQKTKSKIPGVDPKTRLVRLDCKSHGLGQA